MTALDGTGLRAIEELADVLHRSGRQLLICGAKRQPALLIARADFHRRVGAENICPDIEAAMTRARHLHQDRISA
jgi:SulP family sulfate permease